MMVSATSQTQQQLNCSVVEDYILQVFKKCKKFKDS